jgi:Holliday junction resolvase
MRESAIQRAVIVALEVRGAYVVRVVTAGRAGTPDLLACYRGRFYALEVKSAAGRVTALQRHELDRAALAGGTATVVRSVADALAALGFEAERLGE